MATKTLVPVEEYLATAYEPDVDYVDGELIERNMGEPGHGRIQLALGAWFHARRQATGLSAATECRVQVSRDRFRVPDLCVVRGKIPKTKAILDPPLLCVEILSPEDRVARVQPRIQDFLKMGVPTVWVIDPDSRSAWVYTGDGRMHQVEDGILRLDDPAITIPLAEVFDDE